MGDAAFPSPSSIKSLSRSLPLFSRVAPSQQASNNAGPM